MVYIHTLQGALHAFHARPEITRVHDWFDAVEPLQYCIMHEGILLL